MKTLPKLIGATAAVLVTLFLGWVLVGALWGVREVVGAVAIILIGVAIVAASWRVAVAVWRGEKTKFWWLE